MPRTSIADKTMTVKQAGQKTMTDKFEGLKPKGGKKDEDGDND